MNLPLKLPVRCVRKNALLPKRAYLTDAGYDLFTYEDTLIEEDSITDVPTGVAVSIPEGYYGRIVGRSSTRKHKGLFVFEGIIDAGYQGELLVAVTPLDEERLRIPLYALGGESLAQLIIQPVIHTALHIFHDNVDFPPTKRGVRGFGSSGN